MLAVFPHKGADEALFDNLRYGRTGGVLNCTNDQAERLALWPREHVLLFRQYDRCAVQLVWNGINDCYAIHGAYLLNEPSTTTPDTSFLPRAIPGIELVGHVEILEARPNERLPMLRLEDFLPADRREPELTHASVDTAPAPAPSADDFNPRDYGCPHCEYTAPTSARVDRHVEFHHEAAFRDERDQLLRDIEARAEQRRVDEFAPTVEERTDYGQLPPWERERGPE